MDLRETRCAPSEGGVARPAGNDVESMLRSVEGWDLRQDRIHKHLGFRDFRAAMALVNSMAELAEAEGHHPDLTVHYNAVDITV